MKIKVIGGLSSFLLIVLSVLLFIKEDKNIKIIISPKVYSIVKSSDSEDFRITILVNDLNSYYFIPEYISNISLSSSNDEIIPLSLNEIKKSNEVYIYNDEVYYFVYIELEVGFRSDDFEVLMEEATLDITYLNTNEVNLYIGEFNYLFYSDENRDISLNNLLATHALVNGVDTSTGLFLNLGNLSGSNITIDHVEIGCSNIMANNSYLKEIYDIPDIADNVITVLGIEYYDYFSYRDDINNNVLLRKDNEIMLYVQFSYTCDIPYLYRFYVKVHYRVDSLEKTFVIDDFPYINTSSYKLELEREYILYEYDN